MDKLASGYLKDWFESYVNRFRQADGSMEPMLQLKYDHSGRVAAEAVEIAAGLGWNDDSIRLAGVVGWLHDVGRFSQFAQFRTYSDPRSVNHGQRGYEVLSTGNALAECPPNLANHISASVRFHNARTLPSNLSSETLRYAHLVRDADKLDCLRVLDEAIRSDQLGKNPEICWNFPRHGPLNPELLQDLHQGRIGAYSAIRSVDDFLLVQLSWTFDLQYHPARRRAKELGVFEKLAANLPDDPRVRPAVAYALKALDGPDPA